MAAIGQLAFAVVGNVFGGPIGGAIGSAIGGALFGPKLPTIEGPRLQDKSIQTSTYGEVIPILYGTSKIAGQVIWGLPIKETRNERKVRGGKGGGKKQTVVEYTYSATFAVGLCEGPITGFRRVWANGELIYSNGEFDVQNLEQKRQQLLTYRESAFQQKAGILTFYNGSEEQTPDPIIQASEGVNTPGYRGLSYIVFNDLQLAKYGNKLPQITAEIVGLGGNKDPFSFNVASLNNDENLFDVDRGIHVVQASDTSIVLSTIARGGQVDIGSIEQDRPPFFYKFDAITGQFLSRTLERRYSLNGLYRFDGELNRYETYGGQINSKFLVRRFVNTDYPIRASSATFLLHDGSLSSISFRNALSGVVNSSDFIYEMAITEGNQALIAFYRNFNDLNESLKYVIYRPEDVGNVVIERGTVHPSIQADLSVDNRGGSTVTLDGLYFKRAGNDVLKINLRTGEKITIISNKQGGANILDVRNSYLYQDGILVVGSPGAGGESQFQAEVFIDGNVVRDDRASIRSIIEDLHRRVDIGISNLDTLDLQGLTVRGFVIGNAMTVRAAIEPLQTAFFFDPFETGNKLKFVRRGKEPIETIIYDDLNATESAQIEERGSPAPLTRIQEMELPNEVAVQYQDKFLDYEIGTQYARRQTKSSKSVRNVSMPIVLSADEAKIIAERLLYITWNERTSFSIETTRKYAHLEPTDVIDLIRENQKYTCRITKKTEGGNGVIKLDLVTENNESYTQLGDTEIIDRRKEIINIPSPTNLKILDIPPLLDSEPPGDFVYGLVDGIYDNFQGAGLYQQIGEAPFTISDVYFDRETTFGVAKNTLSVDVNPFQIDNESVLEVTILNNGELESMTQVGIDQGFNSAFINGELIQFYNAEQISPTKYKLSKFLRGLRGTYLQSSKQVEDSLIYFFDREVIQKSFVQSNLLNQQITYLAANQDSVFENNESETINYKANSRKSPPVFNIRAFKNEAQDFVIKWNAQANYLGYLSDNPNTLSFQEYILRVYKDSSYSEVALTLTVNEQQASVSGIALALSDLVVSADVLYIGITAKTRAEDYHSDEVRAQVSANTLVDPNEANIVFDVSFNGGVSDRKNHALTVSNVQLVASPSQNGESGAFRQNGTSSSIISDSSDYLMLAEDFTFDFFLAFRNRSTTVIASIIALNIPNLLNATAGSGDAQTGFIFRYVPTDNAQVQLRTAAQTLSFKPLGNFIDDRIYKISIQRKNNVISLWSTGNPGQPDEAFQLRGSITNLNSFSNSSRITIGKSHVNDRDLPFIGFLDSIVVYKGIAKY